MTEKIETLIKYEDYSLDEIAELEQDLICVEQCGAVHICEKDESDAIPENYKCIYFPSNLISEGS